MSAKEHENIFETIDNAMRHLHLSKKVFLIMIATCVLFPPSLMIGSNLVADFLRDEEIVPDSPRISKLVSLVNQLEKGEISTEEYLEETRYVKDATRYGGPGFGYYMWWTIILIFGFWMCYGVVQWIIFRKYRKIYTSSRAIQEKIMSKDRDSDTYKTKPLGDIFEIVDDAIKNMNTTKKMFLVVVLIGFLVPQLLPFAHIILVVQPVQGPIVAQFDLLLEQLENGKISAEYFVEKFRILKAEYTSVIGFSDSILFGIIIMFANALFWTGYGIRQWFVHKKWSKRYNMFKTKDEEINRKLVGE